MAKVGVQCLASSGKGSYNLQPLFNSIPQLLRKFVSIVQGIVLGPRSYSNETSINKR